MSRQEMALLMAMAAASKSQEIWDEKELKEELAKDEDKLLLDNEAK